MKTNRRWFVRANLLSSLAAVLPRSTLGAEAQPSRPKGQEDRYAKLDEILKQPVLRRHLFRDPVIIESLELLRYKDSFLCRVRSRDGAEGISVGHGLLKALYPIFLYNLEPFFIGKDARDLDLLLEKVFIYGFNFRYNGISISTPLATIEFLRSLTCSGVSLKSPWGSCSAIFSIRRSPFTRRPNTVKNRSMNPWS